MVNKSLNESLDSHFTKVKEGLSLKKSKESVTSLWSKIRSLFRKISHYFFPPTEFETTYIDSSGTTIVKKKHVGIYAHIDMMKQKMHLKKEEKKKRNAPPETVDIEKVQAVIRESKK